MSYRSYPPSICPGVPKLGPCPNGWTTVTYDNVLHTIERPVILEDEKEYQLVNARRSRGGIVARSRMMGKDIKTKTQFLAKSDDFVIANRQIVHGACGVVPIELDDSIVSNEYTILNAKNGLWLPYFAYFTHSTHFQQTCFHSSIGVDIEKMVFKLQWWLKHKFHLPSLAEQKKITAILSTWDEAIHHARELLTLKVHHKKTFTEQLLLGKGCFNVRDVAEWQVRAIGELAHPVSRPVAKPSEPYLAIGIRSHGKGTFRRIIEEPRKIMMDTLYRVEPQDLIVNITFAWEGAIAIAGDSDAGGLVSHRFPTYRINERLVDLNFFRNTILSKRFVWELGLISPGGAGRNRVMSKNEFLKLKIRVPSLETQQKIGRMLSTANTEIDLVEQHLNALERQKYGLLQRLLTGEVRVKV